MVKRILMMLSIAIFFLLFAEVVYLRMNSHSQIMTSNDTHASATSSR